MAIIYKKEHGFPLDIRVETHPYEEVMEDNEVWNGFESVVIGDKENTIASFKHKEYRGRLLWVNGFFAALKYKEQIDLDEKIEDLFNPEDMDKSEGVPLINEDGTSNTEVGDWIVTKEGKVRKIEMDDQEDLPFEEIKRFATLKEVENADQINELVDIFNKIQDSHAALWDAYGSELCAGSMINEEKSVQEKIDKLRK